MDSLLSGMGFPKSYDVIGVIPVQVYQGCSVRLLCLWGFFW